MDNKNLRDISGVVIFPILTAVFFIFGAIFGSQSLVITGCLALCVSLAMQFMIMKD
jgi:hypothetical protein